MHPCIKLYNLAANNKIYGDVSGICRITGEKGTGIPFYKWVAKTFNDWGYLKPGEIISNEALFCFDEKSELIQSKTGKEKLQRFRTYSHITHNGEWYCLTKTHKELIYNLIVDNAETVCLTDTGQKHIFFKHRPGMWQLDESFVAPNIPEFKRLHKVMCDLLRLGFSQGEVISGDYKPGRIYIAGLHNWKQLESQIEKHRGSALFNFAAWMLFVSKQDREKINQMYADLKKKKKQKPIIKQKEQIALWN